MIFDGPNRLVILEVADGNAVDAADLYSRAKDWVASGAGAMFPPVFLSSVGGDPIGAGVYAGSYFFLATVDGWRIRPREATHDLVISGNLYPDVPGTPIFAPTLGAWRVTIERTVSSLTQTVATSGGGGTDPSAIASAVWTHPTATELAAAVDLVRKITDNRLEVDIGGQRLVLYDDDGATLLRAWPLATTGGEAVTTATGVQSRRGAPGTP